MKKPCTPSVTTLALGGLAALAISLPASAQLEEIIVTAQKRPQTLQEVPVSVQSFSGEFIEQTGAEDVRDLVLLTPGFNGATEDSFTDAMAIRGISTNDFGIGGDPSVAMFVDGVWAGRTGGVQTSFFDMDRVEIVKGPQGTLFGRNAIAGAVAMYTRKPVQATEGRLSLGLGEYGRREATVTYNTAFSDRFAVRGSLYHLGEDGYLENIEGGDDYGFHDRTAGRISFGYSDENTEGVLTIGYEDRAGNSTVYWDPELGLPFDQVSSDLPGKAAIDESEIFNASLNIDHRYSESLSVTSVTGYKSYDYNYLEDYDARPETITHFFLQTDNRYISQELRLNFETDSGLSGFLGASYYDENIDAFTGSDHDENALCNAIGRTDADDFADEVIDGCADVNFIAYWLDIDPVDVTVDDIAEAEDSAILKTEEVYSNVDSHGYGLFGNLGWDITDRLNLTGGLRYTSDTKRMALQVPDSGGYLGNSVNFEYVIPEFVTDEQTWNKLTGRLALNYLITGDSSVYVNYGRGYKSGGYATYGADLSNADIDEDTLEATGAIPLAFDPETVNSYEAGLKSRLLDDRLQLNVSVYRYDYTDLQLAYFDEGSSLVENLGKARGQGVELDLRYMPIDSLDLFFTWALQDTKITDDTGVVGTACSAACAGNSLPFAPRHSIAAIGTWTLPLGEAELALSTEYYYQSRQYSDLDELLSISQPAQDEVNLRGVYTLNNWRIGLWVENLFSEEYFERGWANADLDNTYGYGVTNTLAWPSKPRTFGMNFTIDF